MGAVGVVGGLPCLTELPRAGKVAGGGFALWSWTDLNSGDRSIPSSLTVDSFLISLSFDFLIR